MVGRMCLFLGLLLLGAMCFPAFADASYDANDDSGFYSIQEAAHSAESVAPASFAVPTKTDTSVEVDRLIVSILASRFSLVAMDPANYQVSVAVLPGEPIRNIGRAGKAVGRWVLDGPQRRQDRRAQGRGAARLAPRNWRLFGRRGC